MIRFVLNFIPTSTKNSRRLVPGKGKAGPRSIKSARACRESRLIKQAILEALGAVPERAVFGDDDIAVDIIVDHVNERTMVAVRSAGQKPTGATGRGRDLQNVQEGILDALQSILYDDDRQVVQLRMARVTKPKENDRE